MFTGIVEAMGRVKNIQREAGNAHFEIEVPFVDELKIDQSVAHNGACLTVVKIVNGIYTVTAIDETLKRTNLGSLNTGDYVNVERCMKLGERLDGHIVQGHVDQTGKCVSVEDQNGSWKYTFEYDAASGHVTVPKGSITVNGVSLTVVDSLPGKFSVAIIPYTYEHTTFGKLKAGDAVNLEFDIIGKYVAAMYNSSRH
jgi:riboflavin synthase